MYLRKFVLLMVCVMLTVCANAQEGKQAVELIKKGAAKGGSSALTRNVARQALPKTGLVPNLPAGRTVTPKTGAIPGDISVPARSVSSQTAVKASTAPNTNISPQLTAQQLSPARQEKIELPSSHQEKIDLTRQLLDEIDLSTQAGKLLAFNTGIGKSVLYIPNVALEQDPNILKENPQAVRGFSMTVVKSKYQGKDEIFGIIPTHSLPSNYENADSKFGVTKKFQAQVILPNGSTELIPAEVVQSSAQSMLDLSLVKFKPENEKLLKPLEMSDISMKPKEKLFLYGEANGIPVSFDREVTSNSLISARTDMIKAPNGQRQGFCGSPWLNMKGQVQAIHTGSVEEENVSHGTHVSFVKKLIEAYHNGGKAEYDLMLDGHVLATLNVDEYISAFAIADNNFNIIYKEDGIGVGGWNPDGTQVKIFKKYSESRIRKAIKIPEAAYLILHSRTPYWNTENAAEPMLVEDRSAASFDESKLREHVYNLDIHESLWTSDVNETGWDSLILQQLDGMPIKK